ncbi:ABC transporter ATP-binding protein [Halobellus inordinatus]|uniref:ABC transporter ATP-binding protein n=1 Tax=Halobellus inordinatus TaxID=1126236 RepID=UPI00210E9356|nr:ABC transporter ATP-binding protein [Halobellus inordinatus]
MSDESLLRVDDLTVEFRTDQGVVRAVDGVSFDVERGETVCLVGESGSGKTVVGESITRVLREPPGEIRGGTVHFDGQDLRSLSEAQLGAVRGDRIAHVFQNPQDSLNPVYTVGWQLIEAVQLHADVSKREARARAIDFLDRVGIPDPASRVDDYPHELSGGMKQRVAIAMALAGDPDLLIADEPTTALDVTIQSRVLGLLEEIQSEFGMGILLVTHDLGVVADVADRVVVLYQGRVMERGDVYAIFDRPAHPYTRSLLDSIPGRGAPRASAATATDSASGPADSGANNSTLTDSNSAEQSAGCCFRDRCPYAVEACRRGGHPPLYHVSGSGNAATPAEAATADGDPDREHAVSCVHFAPDGDPTVVYGTAVDSDATAGGSYSRDGSEPQ